MLYEMRVYAVEQGRMADLHDRMLRRVPPLFRRHGLRAVAHWTALAGPRLPCFIYVLEWADAAARDAGWERFYADPEWWRIRGETNAGSELVPSYALLLLRPNPIWTPPLAMPEPGGAEELHELVLQEVAIGQRDAVNAALAEDVLPTFREAGAGILAVLDMAAGPGIPSVAVLLSWPDFASRRRGRKAAACLPALRLRPQPARPLLGVSDVYLLEPAREWS